MTLTISLEPELARRLIEQASREGLDVNEYVRRIVAERFPSPPPKSPISGLSPEAVATLKILEDWERENATDDPDELARRAKDGEEFMRNLARNRIKIEGPNLRNL